MTARGAAEAAGSGRHRVVVVVGPGRSGTSALTRGLEALGVELGDRLKPATRKNAKGFFEDVELLDINYRVHEALGLRRNGSSVCPVEAGQWASADLASLKDEAVRVIRGRFGRCPLWGFKCGGVLRVLPFWEEVLGAAGLDTAYVVAIRNPLNVALSRGKLDAYREAQEKSDLEWLAQVVPYFRRVLARPLVVVDYDKLMADPAKQMRRVAAALRLPVTEDAERRIGAYAKEFLVPGLRHHRATHAELAASPRVNGLTRDAYTWLLRLANDEITSDAAPFRADWARIEGAFAGMAPLLRHIDVLEGELRRRGPGLRALWRAVARRAPTRMAWPDARLWLAAGARGIGRRSTA
jgi:hypothetical protein